MARACRFERSLLSFDEYEAIRITHHLRFRNSRTMISGTQPRGFGRCATESAPMPNKSAGKRAARATREAAVFLELLRSPFNVSKFSQRL
jgi:hypothetical protein